MDGNFDDVAANPEWFEMLMLEGGVVSIDSLDRQKRIARTIRDRGADSILALKGNQPQFSSLAVGSGLAPAVT